MSKYVNIRGSVVRFDFQDGWLVLPLDAMRAGLVTNSDIDAVLDGAEVIE